MNIIRAFKLFSNFSCNYDFCDLPKDFKKWKNKPKITHKKLPLVIISTNGSRNHFNKIQKFLLSTGRRYSNGSNTPQKWEDYCYRMHNYCCFRIGEKDIGVGGINEYWQDDDIVKKYKFVNSSDFMIEYMPDSLSNHPLTTQFMP